jgi:hypothetical protein
VVDDVRARLVHRRGGLDAALWVVEVADVVRDHVHVLADVFHAGGVAGLEPLDEVDLLSADEADVRGVAIGRPAASAELRGR